MNNFNSPPTNDKLPTWFSNDAGATNSSISVGASPTSMQHTPKRPHVLLFILAGAVIILVAVIAFVVLGSPTSCFTAQDYTELHAGSRVDGAFDPKTNFYSTSFLFQPTTVAYEESSASYQTAEIQRIATFYKNHHEKPMMFNLTVMYDATGDEAMTTLAYSRIDKLKGDLASAGIPQSLIKSKILSYNNNPEDLDDEQPDLPDGVTLELTSSATCDQ